MALWTPDLISPHTWIDFSDTSTLFDATSGGSTVTNGVGIARAEDKSGNGRNFTQSISGSRFTWTSGVQNGLGVARADGGDFLTSANSSSTWIFLHSTASTIFLVIKNGTSANPTAIYSWFGTNAGSSANIGVFFAYDDRNLASPTGLTDSFNFSCTFGSIGQLVYSPTNSGGTAMLPEFSNVITPNAFGLFGIFSDPANATASDRIKLAVNGASKVGTNNRTNSPSVSSPTNTLQIAASGGSSLQLVGDYCEFIIFSSLLSSINQQLVEGYLAWKWGVEGNLPAGHPYKNAAPRLGIARPRINGGLLNNGLINRGLIQ